MAKKTAKPTQSNFVCPSCKAEVKPTFGTATGIAPQKCKCGKYLVVYIWLAAVIWGAFLALWYGVLLLVGVVLPLIVQILLIPAWVYFGYRFGKQVVFRFVRAKEMKGAV